MSAPNTIQIDNVQYVRADSIQPPSGSIKIVVVDRGFVYVGHTTIDGNFLTIDNAKNIRRWGTTKGLGELVNGPLASTVLDRAGVVTVPLRAVILLIDVEQKKWSAI
jgi:hypothetical protein